MIFKLRTSKKTMEIFEEIGASEHLQPFALSKLAISLSIKDKEPLKDSDFKTDTQGLELNRQTITGDYEQIYKSLMEIKEGKHLNDDEFVQMYMKAHLDRGANLLYGVFRYGRDFLTEILRSDNHI